MDEYIKRRRYIKTRLTRAKNKLESQEDPPDRVMCEMMDEQLKELWADLNSCADDIMTTCEDEDAEEHEIVFDEMFDRFNSMKYTLKTDRKECAKSKHLCFNCLKSGHDAGNCTWGGSCRKCKQKHSTLLHVNVATPVQTVSAHTVTASNRALLSTALVSIEDSSGGVHEFRALLDPGADVSFVTENAVQELRLKKERTDVTISGVNSSSAGTAKFCVDFVMRSKLDAEFSMRVNAFVLSKVTDVLPKKEVKLSEISHLQHVTLADPTFCKPGTIDVLLGAAVYFQVLRDGRITGPEGHPVGVKTVWGYAVGGQCTSQDIPASISVHHVKCDSDASINKFWELEEIPRKQLLTLEDRKCEHHFQVTHSRAQDGRYVVRLPFREEVPSLGISINLAEKRLRTMEKRLGSNIELKAQYVKFMDEYLKLGHMELIPDAEVEKPHSQLYYLPHHAVIKADSSTTKLRVVFDASAKTSNSISLNDRLMTGPKLQDDLFDLLIRFRLYSIAMKADIAKMFRQIWVDRRDCDFQRILWREDPDQPIRHYRLLTVTYGTSVAPYLAKRCLQQLADDDAELFPEAAEIAKTDLYMDDLMSSQQDKDKAICMQQQLIQLMMRGEFDLRKWVSNCTELLLSVPQEMRETMLLLKIDESDSVKTLGLSYHPLSDHFKFNVNLSEQQMTVTKRTISSDAGKVFDPIGWLAPVTIKAKMILQSLWRDNLLWDEPVSSAIENEWINYRCKLPHIENIRISRCLLTQKSRPFDLYGFADASEKAYGAVIYIKTRGTTQKYPQILSAKTKVAPTKSVSLPRLELCAALLLARLVDRVTAAMNCHPREIHAWTDSMIVLQWLQSHPGRWKTFVANRVSEIQEIIPSSSWHHVPGVDNPADCISRGILANELQEHSLWWHGPSWLQTYPDGFIEQPVVTVESEILEEKTIVTTNHANANTVDYSILFRYSSLPKLLRVTAMLLRFGLRYKRKKETRPVGPISINELKEALYCWIRMIQKSEFHEEWNCFVNVKRLDNSSRLLSLNPFFDDGKLIRVGGRLKHAQIDAEMKHPILLPKKNKLVELIILNEHAVTLHGGTQLVLATLRRKYWILGARDLTRKLIRQCAICTRHRGEVVSQMMGDLPAARINPTRPFLKTGVDYAGPITLSY